MLHCNGADRACTNREYPTRKGADFRQVSAEAMEVEPSPIGDVRRCKPNRPMGDSQ